jgi:drug/metabolite transporter (DMT)-like permease
VFAAFLTSILFSFSAICGHRSAKMIGGTEANFWRAACATLILGLWTFWFGSGLNGVSFPWFLLSGVIGIGIGDVAFFQTLPRLGPRLTVLLVHCLTAPIGALIEWLWMGTTIAPRQILCALVILAGVSIAMTPGEHLKLSRRRLATGISFGVVASLAGAWAAVLSRRAYQIAHASNEHVNAMDAGYQRVIGGALLAGLALLFVKRNEWRIQAKASHEMVVQVSAKKWRAVWLWIVLNGLAGQTLGVSAMQWALETTPTGLVLAIVAMTPIVVIPMSYFMEGERPTRHSLAGAALAVAGVIGLTCWKA